MVINKKAPPKNGSALDTLLFGIAQVPPHGRDTLRTGVIEQPVVVGNGGVKVAIVCSHLAFVEKHCFLTAGRTADNSTYAVAILFVLDYLVSIKLS